ncbi:MAG TPA: VOC family protein [Candidatus Cybelea sp.]
MNTTNVSTAQSIYPSVRYIDAAAAIAWLKSVLGFEEHEVCPADDGSIAHAELKLAGNLIMLGAVKDDPYGKSPKSLGGVTGGIYFGLESADAIDAEYARAKAAGAEIVRELNDTDYGSHDFAVRDPEGHIWSFGTYRPQAR